MSVIDKYDYRVGLVIFINATGKKRIVRGR